MKKILSIEIGDNYGDFTCIGIIKKRQKTGFTSTYYTMKCKYCGRTKDMLSSTIRYEKGIAHKSCGKGIKTSNKIFYNRWKSMRTRTCNKNYEHADCYINRGIKSDEFKYFIDFYDKMFSSFNELAKKIGEENVSLERIDVNKDYSSANCIWIDKKEQQQNTRRTVYFEVMYPDGHKEIKRDLRNFAKEQQLNYNALRVFIDNPLRTLPYKGYFIKKINIQEKCNDYPKQICPRKTA